MTIRLLFVSGLARNRAPTAAQVFEDWPGIRTDFAGLDDAADQIVSPEQLDWADRIYVFERRQQIRLAARHGRLLSGRPIVDLGIPDLYAFMQPELASLLTESLGPQLREAAR